MTTVEEIEKAISKLSPEQLAKFRAWFEDYDARRFDEKIERDARVRKIGSGGRGRRSCLPQGSRARTMRHLASTMFWEAYQGLPETVRNLADKSFA
jgi:hypothetical protein